MRRPPTILMLCVAAFLLAGCASGPAPEQHPTPTSSATATADDTAADVSAADDAQLPKGVPAPPRSSAFNMDKPAGKAKYLAALKAWHDKLTPAQKAAISDSLGLEVDPQEQAELDWFSSLDPGVRKACIQLPFVALALAALSVPASGETPPESVLVHAKSIADIRGLQTDTELRTILGSISTRLRVHAHDAPPINDPLLEANITAMRGWIEAHCTMPE